MDPNLHLDDTWLDTFTKLRMTAFGKTVIDIANNPDYDEWTFSQKIAFALDKEVTARQERRVEKLLKASRSPHPDACVEDIDYRPDRNLSRELVARLGSCQWVAQADNLILLGKSSVGKTYLSLALLNAACRRDYTARFFRTDDLAAQLAVMDYHDPKRLEFIKQITTTDLLVLDDFLTTPISPDTAHVLFNILAAREGLGSTLVTSQFSPEEWYTSIADKVVAESLLNRLVGGSEIVSLDGPNMRLSPTVIR